MFSDRRCGFASIVALAILAFLVGAPIAFPQALTLVHNSTRSAGNGSFGYNGDFGSATTVSLSSPSYIAFDSNGNQYISDTLNNCVRKIDTAGNVTTVAGLSVAGQNDTCNTASSSNPTASQGLYKPAGLAIDSTNRLYIADSMHNCIRALAANTSGTSNLVTFVGMCGSVPTDSVTPQPNGIAFDNGGNLYIALQDSISATPVNQIVRHNFGTGPVSACRVAGTGSPNGTANCVGISNTVALLRPSGLALSVSGDLYIADTGNNCVRQVVGLATGTATQTTAVGQCINDGSGSSATALRNPYGIAISPTQSLFISESNPDNIVSFVPGTTSLILIGGLPSGAAGAYDSTQDGKSALNASLNSPRGLAFDTLMRLFVADSQNNIARELSTNISFPSTPVGSPSSAQAITFAINQPVNLTTTAGTDYSITSTTCSGVLSPSAGGNAPNTCQVFVRFAPTRPGLRRSPLRLTDSISGTSTFEGMQAVGTGALSIFTPGTQSTVASTLASPTTVTTDVAGNVYMLENLPGFSDIRMIPAAGGNSSVILTIGATTPSTIAANAAGDWFVADSLRGTVSRFGADGSVDASYIDGLDTPVALYVDLFNDLYIAQAGNAHNVIMVYASGARRVIAGSGSNPAADGVTATSAVFVMPSAITLGLNGSLYIADKSGHRVYAVDTAGIIHAVAGNGSAITTVPGQATGTALIAPTSLAIDAAGDLYIADQSTGIIHFISKASSNGSNIAAVLNTSTPPAPNGGLSIALDGSGDLFISKNAANSVVEIAYANPTLNFGSLQAGSISAARLQNISNAGTDNLNITSPFSTTDSHFAVDSASTTCGTTILAGSVCTIGFTFSPTANASYDATSIIHSNSYSTPQPINLIGTGKQIISLALALPAQSAVYGESFAEVVSFTGATTAPTGTIVFTGNGMTLCTVSGVLTATTICNAAATRLGVGTYTVAFNYSGDSNYSPAAGVTTLTVSPEPLVVAVNNAARIYGAANPSLTGTLTGVVSGDTILVSYSTTAKADSGTGTYPIKATLTPAGSPSLANYVATIQPGTLTVVPASTTLALTTSAPSATAGANITFSVTVTASSGIATGTVSFFDGNVLLGNGVLAGDGSATFHSSTLSIGSHIISASYQGSANFTTSAGTVSQIITSANGSFTVSANSAMPFIGSERTATYQVTVSSVGSFTSQVALTCSGLPAATTCSFTTPTVTVAAGSSATTTMTVTATAVDAKLRVAVVPSTIPHHIAPLSAAAILPLEISGLGVLFSGIRRRKILGAQKMRLLVTIVVSLGILGITGCGVPSTAFKTYTINVTGTSLNFPAPAQTTSVVLFVGQR